MNDPISPHPRLRAIVLGNHTNRALDAAVVAATAQTLSERKRLPDRKRDNNRKQNRNETAQKRQDQDHRQRAIHAAPSREPSDHRFEEIRQRERDKQRHRDGPHRVTEVHGSRDDADHEQVANRLNLPQMQRPQVD